MNIVLVVESFGAGVLNAVAMMANELVGEHCVIVVHDYREDTPYDYKALFSPSVNLIFFPIRRTLISLNLFGFWKFSRLINKFSPDVIHLHSSFAGALGRLIFFFEKRVKVFYSPHAFKFVGSSIYQKIIYYTLEYILARGRSRIIACSNGELVHARRLTGSSVLLENSINTQKFLSKIHVAPRDAGRLIVGTVGRLVNQKRPDIFAKVAEILTVKHPTVEFRWVGGGRNTIYERELTLAGVIRKDQLPPSDIPDELNSFDIYMQCSDYEGMPLSVIEAQVVGLPCVVSNCDGNRDIIIDGVTGFVVDDVGGYVEKIDFLIKSVDLRAGMGAEARRRALVRFDKANYLNRLVEIYRGNA